MIHPGKNRGRQEILEPMLLDQGYHQHRSGGGRSRDHAWTAAGEGDDHRDGERGVEANLGIDAGDDGKGDSFRDKRQGDHQPCKDVTANVAEPLVAVSSKRTHEKSIEKHKTARIDDPSKSS
jgi:hypothetical protein